MKPRKIVCWLRRIRDRSSSCAGEEVSTSSCTEVEDWVGSRGVGSELLEVVVADMSCLEECFDVGRGIVGSGNPES